MRFRRSKVVLDVNVLVSGILFDDGHEARILESASEADFDLFVSPEILAEFEDVLGRLKFQLNREEVSAACEFILSVSKIVMPIREVKAKIRDQDDLKILECGLEAKADYIVAGDKDLLTLRRFGKTKIVTPSKFALRSTPSRL